MLRRDCRHYLPHLRLLCSRVQHQTSNSKAVLWGGQRGPGDNLAHDLTPVLYGEGPSDLVHEPRHRPTGRHENVYSPADVEKFLTRPPETAV
jgi:hypothetical protein